MITLHAQRDLSERVNKDHDTQVGGNAVVAVGKDRTTTVAGAARSSVGGDSLEEVRGARHVGVAGSSSKTVVGNSVERVSGHRTVDVKGQATTRARASASMRVDDKASLHAGSSLSVTVGSDPTASGSLSTTGSWNVGADGDVVLRAAKSVRIECGETVLTLLPDKLEIRAKTVDVKGTDLTLVRGKDGVLELASEAKLAAPKTRCFGSGGSMELTSDALMMGAQIRLGARDGDPPKPVDGQEQPPTKPLALKLSDGAFQPYANRPYELVIDGVRFTGNLDGEGGLNQDIPEGATQAQVIVWKGEPPTGESVAYSIALAELPAASSLEGARTRLANLGYAPGTGEQLDPDTETALREFQEDHELEPSGELDADTAGKLSEVHGS
ncbi:MAG: peptidoglycan-binding protein [Polyangiaceae bacterium]|nr:peptidoglycan-binding protein [Polyangiaceae bacterium]